jgi:HSP20 family molecular chaperone IbpA
MKNDGVAPKKKKTAPKGTLKSVAIRETSVDELLEETSEWRNRIAKRAYDLFIASGLTHGHDVDDWFKAEQEFLEPVRLEVKDSKDGFVVKAEVPGFDAEELDIHVNGSYLVIEGRQTTVKKKKKRTGEAYSESTSRQIYRSIELPAAVLADKSRAELREGMLELTLSKAEQPKQADLSAA